MLLAILVGNLGALLVHGVAWQMRKKCLWLLMVFGILSILVSLPTIVSCYTPAIFDSGDSPLNFGYPDYAHRDWAGIVRANGILLVITGVCAAIQMRHIPARWWKAWLALWGEVIVVVAFLGAYFFVSTFGLGRRIEGSLCFNVYISVLVLLAFLRPFVVRWVHPVWQLMLNPGKPITENHD